MLEQDALLDLLMWEAPLHGNECSKLTITHLSHQDSSALQLPMDSSLPQGTVLTLRPIDSKTVQAERSSALPLPVGADVCYSFLSRLLGYIQRKTACGVAAPYYLSAPSQLTEDPSRTVEQRLETLGSSSGDMWPTLVCMLGKATMAQA